LKKKELPADYYLKNFEKVTRFCEKTYFDILQKEEKEFLKAFKQTNIHGRRLYVRLILRRPTFFRKSKLNYPEIKLGQAISSLRDSRLLISEPELSFEELLGSFTVPEIKSAVKDLGLKGIKGTRESIVNSLLANSSDEIYRYFFKSDSFLCPLDFEVVEKLQLLFFGSLTGEMAQFILEDIGVMRFEKVRIDRKNRYFSDYNHLQTLYEWSYYHSLLWEACDLKDREEATLNYKAIKKLQVNCPFLDDHFSRSHNLIGRFFESTGELTLARKSYEQSTLPPSRERLARIFLKEAKAKKAKRMCQLIIEDPHSPEEKNFGEFFIENCNRELGLEYQKRKKHAVLKKEVVSPLKWNKEYGVEAQVLNDYKEKGLNGFHSESSYFNTLAILLVWKIYWKSGKGLFFHPFEKGPRDFQSGGFAIRQEKALNRKRNELLKLNNIDFFDLIMKRYDEKRGTHVHLAEWKKVERRNLAKMIKGIPREDLLKICFQIIESPRQYRNGLPDLVVFSRQKYILTEVKSPNDSIQPSQKKWFDLFSDWGIPYELVRLKR